jgi:L-threonine kinase
MQITAKVPGSCGELVQGTMRGIPFLVTCPVNLYTRVTITDANREQDGLGSKSKAALERVLEYLGQSEFPYGISLVSELPIGKGMASSSADIAAVCFAAAAAFGRQLSAAEVSRIAAGIEPTDGVFFAGIVRMNHMTGECLERMGDLPRFRIAVFDTGGAVDTLKFHEREDLQELNLQNEAVIQDALALLRSPGDAVSIAEAATRSALANQSILPKRNLESILHFVREQGALGVNIAHSGTIIGVLFPPDTSPLLAEEKAGRMARSWRHLQYLQCVEMISGGYTIENR